MTLLFAFIVGSILVISCQAFSFSEPAQDTPLKYTGFLATLRKDVDEVADVLIHSAFGANNITRTKLTAELSDVIDIQLHSLVVQLSEEVKIPRTKNDVTINICCACKICRSRCKACGRSCCCTGSGGCRCTSCSSNFNTTMESFKAPLHSFDEVVKDWAIESKVQLKRTVKSFFATKLAPAADGSCCTCVSCTTSCSQCSPAVPCCCKGQGCACITCSSQNVFMEASSIDFLQSKRTDMTNQRMSLIDSLIDKILVSLN